MVSQIVKFRDGGESAAEEFDKELRRNRLDGLRSDRVEELVHAATPRPERVTAGRAAFGQPGHRPLKRMGVDVRYTRNRDTGHMPRTMGIRTALDGGDPATGIDADADIVGPTSREQSGIKEQVGHG